MNTCNQCNKETKLRYVNRYAYSISKETGRENYQEYGESLAICDNPACPNFGLLQVPAEKMAEKMKEKPKEETP